MTWFERVLVLTAYCLLSYVAEKGAPRIFQWGDQDGRAEIEVGGPERGRVLGAASPLPPARSLWKRCELPSGVMGGALIA